MGLIMGRKGEFLDTRVGRPKKTPFNKIRGQVWLRQLLLESGSSSPTQLDENLGTVTDKNWYRYQSGERIPDLKTRQFVQQAYPATAKYFDSGPCRIFEVMQAQRIHDVVAALTGEIEILFSSQEIAITETNYCLEDPSYAVWLQGLAKNLYVERGYYGFGDSALPLVFASAHAESRFLGYGASMAHVAQDCIEYFAAEYGVDKGLWLSDAEISDGLGKAEEWRVIGRNLGMEIS